MIEGIISGILKGLANVLKTLFGMDSPEEVEVINEGPEPSLQTPEDEVLRNLANL